MPFAPAPYRKMLTVPVQADPTSEKTAGGVRRRTGVLTEYEADNHTHSYEVSIAFIVCLGPSRRRRSSDRASPDLGAALATAGMRYAVASRVYMRLDSPSIATRRHTTTPTETLGLVHPPYQLPGELALFFRPWQPPRWDVVRNVIGDVRDFSLPAVTCPPPAPVAVAVAVAVLDPDPDLFCFVMFCIASVHPPQISTARARLADYRRRRQRQRTLPLPSHCSDFVHRFALHTLYALYPPSSRPLAPTSPMTAVASPPTFTQHNRPTWGVNGMNGGHAGQVMSPDELNRVLMPRKSLQRNNSSSSIASTSSTSSTSTVATSTSQTNGAPVAGSSVDVSSWPSPALAAQRKRPQPKAPWSNPKPDAQGDFRMAAGRPQLMNGLNGSGPLHAAPSIVPSQGQMANPQAMARPIIENLPPGNPPVLYLLSLNGTFERKTISVPFSPDTLRIGRQTNAKTIWIRDVKSSNGTFVNGARLSQENRESEPHELQTGDHLELGIDIVSEDQKTVVHHKVAAKVEHAGYYNASNNLLDVNFGDLDPTNGPMMMVGPQNAAPVRQRNGSQSSMSNNGRMVQGGPMVGPQANGMPHQRGFFFSPISTEQIVKKLQNEMRNARLQSQDLGRTDHFVHALLSKEDIKDIEKPEAPEPTKPIVNGGGLSFRSDNKTRFSDPPAPPPQQPLPEKPDIPSLKRGITERAKPHSQNMSPIRHEGNGSQILQLTEALNNAKKEIESQTSRMRDLEEILHRERQARALAEDLARRLEKHLEEASSNVVPPSGEPENQATSLDAAFEPPNDENNPAGPTDTPAPDADKPTPPDAEVIEASATQLHAQIESLVLEIKDLRQELDVFKQRAEMAESERDTQRKTLAEMALQIRRDTEAKELAEKEKTSELSEYEDVTSDSEATSFTEAVSRPSSSPRQSQAVSGDALDRPLLSQCATITPNAIPSQAVLPNQAFAKSIPYASMISVVLIGVGLMAYINGWQPQPRLER
ncbi:hypothetical protein CIB48_g4418 [Xylaria polymorpha]|nr:hypothetical protein CIB48_g4418 [Xylaria polymorpha]